MAYPTRLFDMLVELADCLCAQIVVDGLPEPCFCGVVPGDQIALEYAGDCDPLCGMAWVRLGGLYAASTVGVASTLPGNCGTQSGVDIELGVVRCVSVGSDDGSPPTPEELFASTELQMADAIAMQRAIVCCPALDTSSVIVGIYTPVGPEGGVVGGTITVSAML